MSHPLFSTPSKGFSVIDSSLSTSMSWMPAVLEFNPGMWQTRCLNSGRPALAGASLLHCSNPGASQHLKAEKWQFPKKMKRTPMRNIENHYYPLFNIQQSFSLCNNALTRQPEVNVRHSNQLIVVGNNTSWGLSIWYCVARIRLVRGGVVAWLKASSSILLNREMQIVLRLFWSSWRSSVFIRLSSTLTAVVFQSTLLFKMQVCL